MIPRRRLISAALIVTALLLVYPCRSLIAEYYYGRVPSLLDDPATDYRDTVDISEETMPQYREAIASLENASSLMPSRSIYFKSLAELSARIGNWTGAMNEMNEPLPAEATSKAEALEKAMHCLKTAVTLEPLNADYHLALGRLYDSIADPASAEQEYKTAVLAAPHNAALRYSVAMRYLLMGKKDEALEQARVLAAMDDSYVVLDSLRKRFMAERRTPEYLAVLYKSYLFKSFEITWRASGKDFNMVKKTVPDNEDAHEAWRLFLEGKGIDNAEYSTFQE